MKVENGGGEGEHGKGTTGAGERDRGREGEKGNRDRQEKEDYVPEKKRQSSPKYTADLLHRNSDTQALLIHHPWAPVENVGQGSLGWQRASEQVSPAPKRRAGGNFLRQAGSPSTGIVPNPQARLFRPGTGTLPQGGRVGYPPPLLLKSSLALTRGRQ